MHWWQKMSENYKGQGSEWNTTVIWCQSEHSYKLHLVHSSRLKPMTQGEKLNFPSVLWRWNLTFHWPFYTNPVEDIEPNIGCVWHLALSSTGLVENSQWNIRFHFSPSVMQGIKTEAGALLHKLYCLRSICFLPVISKILEKHLHHAAPAWPSHSRQHLMVCEGSIPTWCILLIELFVLPGLQPLHAASIWSLPPPYLHTVSNHILESVKACTYGKHFGSSKRLSHALWVTTVLLGSEG